MNGERQSSEHASVKPCDDIGVVIPRRSNESLGGYRHGNEGQSSLHFCRTDSNGRGREPKEKRREHTCWVVATKLRFTSTTQRGGRTSNLRQNVDAFFGYNVHVATSLAVRVAAQFCVRVVLNQQRTSAPALNGGDPSYQSLPSKGLDGTCLYARTTVFS